MVAWIGLASLAVVLSLQMRIDALIWGTRATPGVLLTAGYTAVAAIYAAASIFFDFNAILPATYALLCVMSLMLVVVSRLTCSALSWKRDELDLPIKTTGKRLRVALIIVVLSYGIMALRVASDAGGLWSSESMELLSSGFLGHLSIALSFMIIWYAVGTVDRKLMRFSLLAVSLLVLSFNPVKGWTLIPVMAIALAEISRSRSATSSIRPLVVAGMVGMLVFFLIYLARAALDDFNVDLLLPALEEIFKHLLFYSTSGLFGLNAVVNGLELPGGFAVLFAPFVNVVRALTGESYVSIISDVYVVGLLDHGVGGNVFSMYGSLIGYAGMFTGIFLSMIIVSVAYLLFAWTWRLRFSSARVAALYVMAVLAFGWFEYYLWHLTPYEIVLFSTVTVLGERMVWGNRRLVDTDARYSH